MLGRRNVDASLQRQWVTLDTGNGMMYRSLKQLGMESPAEKCFLPELMTPTAWDPLR